MKTFIRRPGNKTRYLKYIKPLIPEFSGKYIEPFVGTGAVYLNLLPKNAILNDLNNNIITIWKLVKTDPQFMILEIDKFKKHFLQMNNEEKLEFCKNIMKQLHNYRGKYKTVMYLLLVYCSFNACIEHRFSSMLTYLNKKNSCHIFTDEYKQKLLLLPEILKNTKIYNKDYKEVLLLANSGDFVFLDPPYIEDKDYDFVYNKNENFNFKELVLECKKLDERKVKWMMTQIDTEMVRESFNNYRIISYKNTGNFNNSKKSKS